MLNKLVEQIKKHNKIILLRHIFPDFDAIGSQMALYHFIIDNFENKIIKIGGKVPNEYKKIAFNHKLRKEDFVDALVIVTDTANRQRIDIDDIDYLKEANIIFKIDHHVNVDNYANLEIVDSTFPATCELLTILFKNSNYIFSKEVAFKLFHGLVTDTERFLYRNVTKRTFDSASILISKGIEIKDVYENVYNLSESALRLKGYILSNFVLLNNNLAYIKLDKNILTKFGIYDVNQVALWVNILGEISSAMIWIFFIETDDGCRVELRSRYISVREIATKFGGGGHETASGAKLNNIEEYKQVVNYCIKVLSENNTNSNI
ncbi:bifunctional oligoribonuclease and PAP phosphatase NrnA [Spiroplasma corruscae]|uniref:Bifunctional oligoribonuclease and PAP phosphatase NrnA n=1 Tax=Spiroplasma corruscae TaxID=216934 RepID=A0A222EP45_9MOLU|nr:bifunctional oligoribonuclease/PAP phosphatase NrnA [Spiroplasma corruscae]ASP28171.1 bifunctional oligoribonuclease and PAP phosphatase NrnA [Spiroplasma corruscae]